MSSLETQNSRALLVPLSSFLSSSCLCLVERRFTFAALVIFLFTEPIRSKDKPIPVLLFEDFWDGLPMESGTHTNVRMAAIYSRHSKPKAD